MLWVLVPLKLYAQMTDSPWNMHKVRFLMICLATKHHTIFIQEYHKRTGYCKPRIMGIKV